MFQSIWVKLIHSLKQSSSGCIHPLKKYVCVGCNMVSHRKGIPDFCLFLENRGRKKNAFFVYFFCFSPSQSWNRMILPRFDHSRIPLKCLCWAKVRACAQSLETSQRQIKQLKSDCQGRESLIMSQSHSHHRLFHFPFLLHSLGRVLKEWFNILGITLLTAKAHQLTCYILFFFKSLQKTEA